jgi:SAM-dependent methyltransferase
MRPSANGFILALTSYFRHCPTINAFILEVFELKAILDFLNRHYAQPLANQLDLDSSVAIGVHRRIIQDNPLLLRYYRSMYNYFRTKDMTARHLNLPSLEIGSGGGFLKEFLPDVITSDVVGGEGIDRVEDGCHLGFPDNSLKAVFANGVLHHISDPSLCLSEIQRVLAPGGIFVCNEPSSSILGYFVNKHFHHEPTDKTVATWCWKPESAGSGRLTSANMAVPYIIFRRDAALFHEKFPSFKIESIKHHDFLRYILSGGLSYRPFLPKSLYWTVDAAEALFRPLMFLVGQEMLVTVRRN